VSVSTAQKDEVAKPVNYAEAKHLEREAARKRIHEHVLHPIDTPSLLRDPLFHPTSPIDSTIGSLKLLLAAVAVHGFIILVFAAVNDFMGERGDYNPPERVVVQVIETLPPPPPIPLVIEETIEEVVEAPLPPDFIPKDPTPPKPSATEPAKLKKPRVIKKPDPTPNPPDPVVPPPRRRISGLDFSSTTTGGKGASFATGSTRMGDTATTAVDPDIAKQEPEGQEGTTKGTASGTGKTATREQRTASNIPTRDSVFIKPKRKKPSKPPYPTTLKAQGIEGDVQVRVTIDVGGKVTKVSVLKGSGHKAFDDAAKNAAIVETFTPATRDGKAVTYTLSYSYRFRIEEN
jgi:TonB family protein